MYTIDELIKLLPETVIKDDSWSIEQINSFFRLGNLYEAVWLTPIENFLLYSRRYACDKNGIFTDFKQLARELLPGHLVSTGYYYYIPDKELEYKLRPERYTPNVVGWQIEFYKEQQKRMDTYIDIFSKVYKSK